MKKLCSLFCVCTYLALQASAPDQMREAIIQSNLKQVVQLLPSISETERTAYIQLAKTIEKNRYRNYYKNHVFTKLTLPIASCFVTGITLYLKSKRLFDSSIDLIIGTNVVNEIFNRATAETDLLGRLPYKLHDLKDAADRANSKLIKPDTYKIIAKAGMACGIACLAQAAFLTYKNIRQLRDLYMQAIKITQILIVPPQQSTPITA